MNGPILFKIANLSRVKDKMAPELRIKPGSSCPGSILLAIYYKLSFHAVVKVADMNLSHCYGSEIRFHVDRISQ